MVQRTARLMRVDGRVPAGRDDGDHGPVDRRGRRAAAGAGGGLLRHRVRRPDQPGGLPSGLQRVHARLLPGAGPGPSRRVPRLPRAGLSPPEPLPARSGPPGRVRGRSGRAILDRAIRVLAGGPRPPGARPHGGNRSGNWWRCSSPGAGLGLFGGAAHGRSGRRWLCTGRSRRSTT